MGSAAAPKHNFWTSATAKTSLVHRLAHVLLSPKKEAPKLSKGEEVETRTDDATFPASEISARHRLHLEMDVERLIERLRQERELRSALENAMKRAAGAFSSFPRNLPAYAQELLTDVAMLEVAVSNLEDQMIGLEMQIRHERNERLNKVIHQPLTALVVKRGGRHRQQMIQDCPNTPTCSVERLSSHEIMAQESVAALYKEAKVTQRIQSELSNASTEIRGYQSDGEASTQSSTTNNTGRAVNRTHEVDTLCRFVEGDTERKFKVGISNMVGARLSDHATSHENLQIKSLGVEYGGASSGMDNSTMGKLDKLWKQPNRLSQEMVSCMIGIYCHLADPLEAGKHTNADNVPSPSSSFGNVTSSSLSSLSDLSSMSFARSPPHEAKAKEERSVQGVVDPYRTYEKLDWGEIGRYSLAIEVSWMSVGKEQLQYAADALRLFRSLVEQLSRVNATSLSHDEKLAFWINIYNALMMHAYLAYGFPKDDVKYFALMQKAAYTVGGHFFNAMAIEHVLLRVKAPSYRPQIALLLALHKVKIPEGASKFAISRPEPLVLFALSCGAWSSPAVRIYTAENIQAELRSALHDYVRAAVGIGCHGKVLIPKLMHCYAKELNIHKATGDADDGHAFILWLSSFLPACQATRLQDMVQRRVGCPPTSMSTSLSVQPFTFRLRYLFLQPFGTD